MKEVLSLFYRSENLKMFGNLTKDTQLIKQQDSSVQGPSLGSFLCLLKVGVEINTQRRKTL